MNVLILAAGYGTRLAAVAKDTPKPLLEVNGRPLIDHILKTVKGISGLNEVVVITNNKFYNNFIIWSKTHVDCKIRVVNDGTNTPEERLGSVGDMSFAFKKETKPTDWLVVGGDNLFDQSLDEFMKFARTKSPAVSIGLYDIKKVEEATKFGVSALGANNKVVSFQEKPAKPASSLITMCVYYFPSQTLPQMDVYRAQSTGKGMDAAGSYIQWLVETNDVYGFQFAGRWYDIGSIESLKEAQEHFK